MERFQLIHRDDTSDSAMRKYREIMAQKWFPRDTTAQIKYINSPENPKFGSTTDNMCLTDDEGKVVGTISTYGFAKPRHIEMLSNNGVLKDLPKWLTEIVYQGDISTIPDAQGQGLATLMIKEMNNLTESKIIFGITRKDNKPMRKTVKAAGGRFIKELSCLFIKFSENKRPNLNIKSKYENVQLQLDKNFPPVIQMFYNKKGDLLVATIATSANFPNINNSKPTGQMDDLYPNQCVGFINPALTRKEVKKIIPFVYSQIGRFRYASLYQMTRQDEKYKGSKPIDNGFDLGWRVYKY